LLIDIVAFVFAQDSLTLQFIPGSGIPGLGDVPIPTADVTAVPVSTIDGGAATVYEIADNRPGEIHVDASGTHQITETITASASGWTISVGVEGAGTGIKCQKSDGDSDNGSCEIQAGAGGVAGIDVTRTGALSNIVLPIATGAGSSGSGSASGSNDGNGNNNGNGNCNNNNSASPVVGMRVGLEAVLGGLVIGGFMLI